MRPVRRRASPRATDFEDYRDAFVPLVARLGSYCSYCERKLVTQLAVEHIQPKGLLQHAHRIGRWDNFLLACVNCNSTKRDKDVDPSEVLLPDRDNTFVALQYTQDGAVKPGAGPAGARAARTLSLVGLDKRVSQVHDENGKLVAIDRVSQRLEAWLLAQEARADVDAHPGNAAVVRGAVRTARESGFFSIWMTVFEGDPTVRRELLAAFPGTTESGCFDAHTTDPVSPAPNPDGLPHGAKS